MMDRVRVPDRERPARGLADAPARRAPRGVRRVVARRRGPRPRPGRLDGLPRLGGARRRPDGLPRRARRLEPARWPTRSAAVAAGLIVPLMVGSVLDAARVVVGGVPRDRGFGHRRGDRLRRPRSAGDAAERPLPPRARAALLGERPVRRLGGVPVGPSDRADRRPRRGPRREHVGDPARPDLVHRPVLARGALPADPPPRPRGADDVDPAPHRRPGGRRLALPPRRHRLRDDRGVPRLRPDRHRPLGAARRLLGRREAGPGRDQPVAPAAHPGGSRQPDARRALVRRPGHDRRPVDDLERPGPRDRPGRRRQARPLLAGDDVRRLHPDRLDDDRRRRPTDRPAGDDLLAGTLDAIPTSSVRAPSTFRVIPQSSPVPRRVQPDRSAVGRPRHDPAPVRCGRLRPVDRGRAGRRTPSRRRFRPWPTSPAG